MAGKLRHFLERDGRFYSRIVVPKELRGIIGRSELRAPLGADRREAVRRHHIEVAKLMGQVAAAEEKLALTTGARPAQPRYPMSGEEMAQLNYRLRLDQDAEARVASPAYARVGIDDRYAEQLRVGIAGAATDAELDELVGHRIAMFRAQGHTEAVRGSAEWRGLAMMLCVSEYEALERAVERDDGVTGGETAHPLLTAPVVERRASVSMRALFRDFLAHLKGLNRADATIRKWQGIYNDFCDHFRHDDAARVTKAEVRAWRDKLLEDREASTVRRGYLPAINAAFNWAVEEDRLPENPAKDVKQAAAKTIVGRPKGFSDAEALAIIKHSRTYRPKVDAQGRIREAESMTRAKQWVPLLCAFTGARVSEITQLRCEDVREEGGVHFLRITPDAGGNKSHEYRDVPLHDQIIAEGFLKVVDGLGEGPLFYEGAMSYIKAQRQGNRLATWLGAAGLVPKGLQANHAWRHRFQTLGRRYSQSEMVVNAICGHGRQGDVSHSYGDAELVTMKRVIDAMPFFEE